MSSGSSHPSVPNRNVNFAAAPLCPQLTLTGQDAQHRVGTVCTSEEKPKKPPRWGRNAPPRNKTQKTEQRGEPCPGRAMASLLPHAPPWGPVPSVTLTFRFGRLGPRSRRECEQSCGGLAGSAVSWGLAGAVRTWVTRALVPSAGDEQVEYSD